VIAATGAGYRLAVKLPLAGLDITPDYGQLFGLAVHVGEDDNGDSGDAEIAWRAMVASSAQVPTAFGAGRLEGPEALHVYATTQGTGVLLKWTHFAWNDAYEVYRSASPYFTPDGAAVVTVYPPDHEYLDTLLGSAWHYLIRARQDGLGVTSNRTGKFQFDLTVP
jgi:hypothetical protein